MKIRVVGGRGLWPWLVDEENQAPRGMKGHTQDHTHKAALGHYRHPQANVPAPRKVFQIIV